MLVEVYVAAYRIKKSIFGVIVLGLIFLRPLFADLADVEEAQRRAKQNFINQFLEVTKEKNVMGKSKTPDGKIVQSRYKTGFDKDGGGFMLFQSDLTYHDWAYIASDPNVDGSKKDESPILHWWVSSHGGINEAGGSSYLERLVYNYHKKYSKEDKKQAKELNNKTGVKYRSVFKITTREILDKNKKNEDEPRKVERAELRPEVKVAIEKAGEESAEGIFKVARDKESVDDPNSLPNSVFLRYAAGTATQAWWNSTLANLAQRRANIDVPSLFLPGAKGGVSEGRPRLNEGVPTCEEWEETLLSELPNLVKKPEEQKEIREEIQKRAKMCKTMVSLPYNKVAPRYVPSDEKQDPSKGIKYELKEEGIKKEDAFERDLRLQLEVLAKAGVKVTSMKSNWTYGPKDDVSKLTDYDENGRANGERYVTVEEQLNSYNNQLKEAWEGIKEVKTRIPKLDMPNPLRFQIKPGTRSAMDINGTPPYSAYEEVGISNVEGPPRTPITYTQMLQQK